MRIKKNEILKCIKILMLSIFVGILVLTLLESSDKHTAEAKEKSTHSQGTKLYGANSKDIRIWTDPDTGVQYVIYSGYRSAGGITPRINLDGTLYQP